MWTHEHEELKRGLKRFIDAEINPHVERMGGGGDLSGARGVPEAGRRSGYLGLTKPDEYGGSGLDYSYSVAMAEALGRIDCGGVPMAIGVQTDMATPALARFGSDELRASSSRRRSPATIVACLGVSRGRRRLRRRLDQDHARGRTAATTSSTAARCGPPTARRPTGCACSPTPAKARPHKNKIADHACR